LPTHDPIATHNFISMQPPLTDDAWPEPVQGLSGRLRVAFEDLAPGLRHAVHVELRNYATLPIAVSNGPRIQAVLRDAQGHPVPTSPMAIDAPVAEPQWGVIPRDAYLGYRIDMQSASIPDRENGVASLAIAGNLWELAEGMYVLHTTLHFEHAPDAPTDQWCGELQLPAVRFEVTAVMLARSG
jgi:hypothetical protein